MRIRKIVLSGACVAALLAVAAVLAFGRGAVEARRLQGAELLGNLRGYLRVGRIDEAAQVIGSLEDPDCLDQARYEVAEAYVANGQGEQAIALLDKITLHDRSFAFQRAVLREKIRALFSFFFDPSGDLRTPAQLDDYLFHSGHNPDESQRSRNPEGFDDPNELLDYFDSVASQIEDVLEIQGCGRSAEPALAESYDAIQILLYGRGLIDHDELSARLEGSRTGGSARTLYLLGSQHFAEANYKRAFKTWGDLVKRHPESDEALRAFSKTFELFEARGLLEKAFAFWPMDRPEWLDELEGRPRFKDEAEETRAELRAHRDIAKYLDVSRGALDGEPEQTHQSLPSDVFKQKSRDVRNAILAESPGQLILERDHSLGWRLQTEFREFLIRRADRKVFTPSEKKPVVVKTSYHGVVCFRALRFENGDAYRKFAELDAIEAAKAAASLAVAAEWTEDLGPLSENGKHVERTVHAPITEPGFYLIAARARYVPVVAATQMAVVAEKVLTWASPEGALFRVVNRETGRPVHQARIHGTVKPVYRLEELAPGFFDGSRTEAFLSGLRIGFSEGKRDELTTDNDEFLAGFAKGLKLRDKYPQTPEPFEAKADEKGTAYVPVPERWKGVDCEFAAKLDGLGKVMPITVRTSQIRGEGSWRALFYAERPVFQPGEHARVKGILRKLGPAGLALPEDEELEFMLWHRNMLCGVFRAAPNEVGTVALEMPLPPSAEPGAYCLTIGHAGKRYPVFRVDRGERPLVNVAVSPDSDVVFAGSTVRGRVKVHRVGHIAATGVPVKLTVYRADLAEAPRPADPREDFFQAVELKGYPDGSNMDILKGRLRGLTEVWTAAGPTDASGEYPFSFASDAKRTARYVIVARVRTLPNRSATAAAEVVTNDLPVFLEIRPERSFYYPGETLRAELATSALDGRNVSTKLKVVVARTDDRGRTSRRTTVMETDDEGRATLSVPLGTSKPTVKVGVLGASGWVFREVPFSLRQIGARATGKGIALQLDRKAYYPGETARVTIQVDRPGANVMLTVSRERIRHHREFRIEGTTGTFDVPLKEADAPNVFFYAVSVWNDEVHNASVELPIVPSHKFLKVVVETDHEDYAAGEPVGATVKVLDCKGKAVPGAEVSLAAVLTTAYTLQEDLTPDLARYFLNHRLPLSVKPGEGAHLADVPRSGNFWLAATFAWGIYKEPLGGTGVVAYFGVGGGGAGCYGYRHGGGSKRSSTSAVEAFAKFLREHGLTLFYEARLVTDAEGKAKVEFLLPPEGGEFRFTARALTPDTLVGEIRRTVRFRQDVVIQAPWPVSIREGERFEMPLFIVNGSGEPVKGVVSVESDLPVSIVWPEGPVEVAPGVVARVDLEIDARKLPEALADPDTGIYYPTSFARFAARFTPADGRKITNEAMVRVNARGIPIGRVAVALARAGSGPKQIRFDLERALPRSARVTLRALTDPTDVARWLIDELGLRAEECYNTARTYAWAAEALAEGLDTTEIEAGMSLKIDSPLLAAFSRGISPHGEDVPYFLAFASATRRGVRLPSEWAEAKFTSMTKKIDADVRPRQLWALSVYASPKEDKLEAKTRLRHRLDQIRRKGVERRVDWAYLALALDALGRRTKASWCLEKGLSSVLVRRRAPLRSMKLEEAGAFLLAAARLALDSDTLGALYASVLQSLAREPRPDPWSSAVAAHALVEWGKLYRAPAKPVKVTVGGRQLDLAPGAEVTVGLESAGKAMIIVAPPEGGTVAVEAVCAHRVAFDDLVSKKDHHLTRQFARLDKDGNAEVMPPGDGLRLGDSLMMILEAESPETPTVVIPSAGPWRALPLRSYPRPTRRVRSEFVLSPERSERVLAAVEEERVAHARQEMLEAIETLDYLEGPDCTDAKPRTWYPKLVSRGGPARFRQKGPMALVFRPDRTGSFIAPAAYVEIAEGAPPAAAAPPFPFRVIEGGEPLPVREAEVKVDESVSKAVAEAMRLIPDGLLTEVLRDHTGYVDLRPIAIAGLLESESPEAPEAYAALAWPSDGTRLELLARLIGWRSAMILPHGEYTGPGGLDRVSASVLKRALESDELAGRIALSDDIGAVEIILGTLDTENRWRKALCSAARSAAAADSVSLRLLSLADVVAKLRPERADGFFRICEDLAESEVGRYAVRGPGLKAAVEAWAAESGLEASFAEDVPDLESGEFVLVLPRVPSVRDLDRSLAGLCLRARRKGRAVSISLDANLARLRPEVGAVLTAKNPESRLRAYLANWKPGELGLLGLVNAWRSDGNISRYTPRVEIHPDRAAPEFLGGLLLDGDRPVGEQLSILSAQGLRLETAGGVLKFVFVE